MYESESEDGGDASDEEDVKATVEAKAKAKAKAEAKAEGTENAEDAEDDAEGPRKAQKGKGEDDEADNAEDDEADSDSETEGTKKTTTVQKGKLGKRKMSTDETGPKGKSMKVSTTISADGDLLNTTSTETVVTGTLKGNTVQFVVNLKLSDCAHRLLLPEAVHDICASIELQDPVAQGINRVSVREEKGKVKLMCEGVSLRGFMNMPEDLIDHRHIKTNDVKAVLDVYGVEAARASVVQEVKNVFGHYGIEVNHRHLSLIVDFMAMGGDLRPFSRVGMVHSASPLLQMSFETTMQFMSTACNEGLRDCLRSPASSIVMGQPPAVGTGIVSILVDLNQNAAGERSKHDFTF